MPIGDPFHTFKAEPQRYEVREKTAMRTLTIDVFRTQKMADNVTNALNGAYQRGFAEGKKQSQNATTVFLRGR